MKNKYYEDNLELLERLDGLSYTEIEDLSIEETGTATTYTNIIQLCMDFESLSVDDGNNIMIDRYGEISAWIEYFNLDLDEYEVEFKNIPSEDRKELLREVKSPMWNAHFEKHKYREYATILTQLDNLGLEIWKIHESPSDNEICVQFKANDMIGNGSMMYFKWPIDCIEYLKETLWIKDEVK